MVFTDGLQSRQWAQSYHPALLLPVADTVPASTQESSKWAGADFKVLVPELSFQADRATVGWTCASACWDPPDHTKLTSGSVGIGMIREHEAIKTQRASLGALTSESSGFLAHFSSLLQKKIVKVSTCQLFQTFPWSRAILCHCLWKVRWMLHCRLKLQKAICRVSFFISPRQDVMKNRHVIDGLVTCLPYRNCTGALFWKKKVYTINAKQW